MKRFFKTYLLGVFVILNLVTFSQCPNVSLRLKTQSQIDNFSLNYPNCSNLLKGLIIDDDGTDPITNLNGLSSLVSIQGEFNIRTNPQLENLEGLNNLTSAGSFALVNNFNLVSLEALENLTNVTNNLTIFNADALTTLTGLENITSIGGSLKIISNDKLSTCENTGICVYLSTTTNVADIRNNAIGCKNRLDIIDSCSSILPLTFISFQANLLNENVLLNWTTAQEVNTSHFEIERFSKLNEWKSIGVVNASNTFGEHKYEFIDETPISDLNKYRIKQIDLDDSFEYSKILQVTVDVLTENFIIRNPVKNVLSLSVNNSSTDFQVTIYSTSGSLISKIEFPANSTDVVHIDVETLSKGLYIVNLMINGTNTQSGKFVKE